MWYSLRKADQEAHDWSPNPTKQKNMHKILELFEEIFNQEECFTLKDLSINGRDLIGLGYDGKIIGKILKDCLNKVILEEKENFKEPLLEYVKENYKIVDL